MTTRPLTAVLEKMKSEKVDPPDEERQIELKPGQFLKLVSLPEGMMKRFDAEANAVDWLWRTAKDRGHGGSHARVILLKMNPDKKENRDWLLFSLLFLEMRNIDIGGMKFLITGR